MTDAEFRALKIGDVVISVRGAKRYVVVGRQEPQRGSTAPTFVTSPFGRWKSGPLLILRHSARDTWRRARTLVTEP